MPIPLQYKPFVERLLGRSRKGTGKWKESALLDEVFQVADGQALLTYRTDPAEGPVRISVEILNRMGELVYSEMLQRGDPDFDTLDELNETAKRSLQGAAKVPT